MLHEGGMAVLMSVTRPGDDLPMLMKVPRLREGEDPAAIVSFEMEQMIMPRLRGPHVPRFIAMGGFEAQPYIVMERIEGGTLGSRLREAPMPAEVLAPIGAAIADALDDLHHQHVVHLDVKPANILFRATGEAVIDHLFEEHAKLGSALLLITHDAGLAERCGRRLDLTDGQIVGDSRSAGEAALRAIRHAGG